MLEDWWLTELLAALLMLALDTSCVAQLVDRDCLEAEPRLMEAEYS